MISIVGSQKSTNYGSWKRIDFTEDSVLAASCILADMVNNSEMEPCLASNYQVRVVGNTRTKVLEGLKKPIFSTSRMCEGGYDVHGF